MTTQSETTAAKSKSKSASQDGISIAAFWVVTLLTNFWFFSQALSHVH